MQDLRGEERRKKAPFSVPSSFLPSFLPSSVPSSGSDSDLVAAAPSTACHPPNRRSFALSFPAAVADAFFCLSLVHCGRWVRRGATAPQRASERACVLLLLLLSQRENKRRTTGAVQQRGKKGREGGREGRPASASLPRPRGRWRQQRIARAAVAKRRKR